MNEIDVLRKCGKDSKKKIFKATIKIMNPRTDYQKRFEIFERLPDELIVSAVNQIKYAELYDMLDKKELMNELAKKEINFEDFDREIERYRTAGFLAIDRYIDVLIKNNHTSNTKEKFNNLSSYADETKNFREISKFMSKEQLIDYRQDKITHSDEQINEIIQTVYDNRIVPYITSEKIKTKDVVGLGKIWMDSNNKIDSKHR